MQPTTSALEENAHLVRHLETWKETPGPHASMGGPWQDYKADVVDTGSGAKQGYWGSL